ncbi:uncharacterized protein [Triticum aestivum]|uniref:uncharacterized protein isoform X1 n=1 Tax=Triticum aestivum TaxID=4565 RepID=UPI001D032081|nr:uncharacterized protein LOC123067042 isoform X1 [Triticum aestivum]
MSSLLWRSAAAAARRQLGRPPSPRTTIRSMASSSSSCSSSEKTKQGAGWLIIANILIFNAWIYSLNNKTNAHTEEMRSVRQEIQRLQASNAELKRDLANRAN